MTRKCWNCSGEGAGPENTGIIVCKTCNGTGYVKSNEPATDEDILDELEKFGAGHPGIRRR